MNHWNLFKESWRIFWRHPALWLFGLLAALGGGFTPRYNFNFNFNPSMNLDPELLRRLEASGQRLPEIPLEFRSLLNQIFNSQTIGTLIVIGIVWTIIAFLLTTYADGALIRMVNAIAGGEKVSVGFGFRAGARRFLHLLAVRFTLALPVLLLALIAASLAGQLVFNPGSDFDQQQFLTRSFGAVAALGTLGFVVAVLMMGIGISAERAVVLDELPIWPAIVKGWKSLWGKFGDYFTIVLLFIGIAIVVGLLLACVLVPLLCGVVGLGTLGAASRDGVSIFTRVMVLTLPAVLATFIVGLFIGTLANIFTSSVWTLAYREWNKSVPPADTTLQPVAPLEPIQSIESNPSSQGENA